MTDWLPHIWSCIDHVRSENCEKIKENNILIICQQDQVLNQEQLQQIVSGLSSVSNETKQQLKSMLNVLNEKHEQCDDDELTRAVVDELKTCVDAKVRDPTFKCAKQTRDEIYRSCRDENERLKSMSVLDDRQILIDESFYKEEFDPSELQRRKQHCKRTAWSDETLTSLSICQKHLEKQTCKRWRSVGKEHPIMICGLDNVLNDDKFNKLYETIHYWGTNLSHWDYGDILNNFDFMSLMQDNRCKLAAGQELIAKAMPIVRDTLYQNGWEECENYFLQLTCDQIIDPNDPKFPPWMYCKDKAIITAKQEENISKLARKDGYTGAFFLHLGPILGHMNKCTDERNNDTLDQNDWNRCKNHFLQLPCNQIIDPNDNKVRPEMIPLHSYCKDKAIITAKQKDNISAIILDDYNPYSAPVLDKMTSCAHEMKNCQCKTKCNSGWCETTGPCNIQEVWNGKHWKWCDCQCKTNCKKEQATNKFWCETTDPCDGNEVWNGKHWKYCSQEEGPKVEKACNAVYHSCSSFGNFMNITNGMLDYEYHQDAIYNQYVISRLCNKPGPLNRRASSGVLPDHIIHQLETEGTELKVIGDNCGHSVEGVKISRSNNILEAELDCNTFECDKYHCNTKEKEREWYETERCKLGNQYYHCILDTQTRVSSMNIAFREKNEMVWKTFANLTIKGSTMVINNICDTM